MSQLRSDDKPNFKIGEACRLAGIQPYVLRYWESEFPALAATRPASGPRVYSREEVDLICRIKALLYEEGYTIAGARKKLDSELSGVGVVARPDPVAGRAGPGSEDGEDAELEAPRPAGSKEPPESSRAGRPALSSRPENRREESLPIDTPPSSELNAAAAGIEAAVKELEDILEFLENPRGNAD